eukprot:5758435-Alexandrium_andersonii.AAC.1
MPSRPAPDDDALVQAVAQGRPPQGQAYHGQLPPGMEALTGPPPPPPRPPPSPAQGALGPAVL